MATARTCCATPGGLSGPLLASRRTYQRLQEVTVPRYNITLSSSIEARKPVTMTAWARHADGATEEAKHRLTIARLRQRTVAKHDQWEVWTGNPPYVRKTTVSRGSVAGER